MPKSRRDKPVALTKTKSKKSRDTKSQLIADLHACLQRYSHVFVFTVQCMRNERWKRMRADATTALGETRFFYGRLKVMRHALTTWAEQKKTGSGGENSARGVVRMSRRLVGQSGLLFCNVRASRVTAWLDSLSTTEFARAGSVADQGVTIEAGQHPHLAASLQPRLRSLGVQCRLVRAVVQLDEPHVVCEAGQQLGPEQCRLLELLGQRLDQFRVRLRCSLALAAGKFRVLATEGATVPAPQDAEMCDVNVKDSRKVKRIKQVEE